MNNTNNKNKKVKFIQQDDIIQSPVTLKKEDIQSLSVVEEGAVYYSNNMQHVTFFKRVLNIKMNSHNKKLNLLQSRENKISANTKLDAKRKTNLLKKINKRKSCLNKKIQTLQTKKQNYLTKKSNKSVPIINKQNLNSRVNFLLNILLFINIL